MSYVSVAQLTDHNSTSEASLYQYVWYVTLTLQRLQASSIPEPSTDCGKSSESSNSEAHPRGVEGSVGDCHLVSIQIRDAASHVRRHSSIWVRQGRRKKGTGSLLQLARLPLSTIFRLLVFKKGTGSFFPFRSPSYSVRKVPGSCVQLVGMVPEVP